MVDELAQTVRVEPTAVHQLQLLALFHHSLAQALLKGGRHLVGVVHHTVIPPAAEFVATHTLQLFHCLTFPHLLRIVFNSFVNYAWHYPYQSSCR